MMKWVFQTFAKDRSDPALIEGDKRSKKFQKQIFSS